MNFIKQASKSIYTHLMWRTSTKNQPGVAETLANKQVVHEVYGLGDAGLLDMFFCFLSELGIMQIFENLEPKTACGKRKSPIPFSGILLVYLMRLVAGIKFFSHVGPVLLQSQSLMHITGFNGAKSSKETAREA